MTCLFWSTKSRNLSGISLNLGASSNWSAANTANPHVGVPVKAALEGVDALYSIVQMPKGIPVATVAIGKAGAANAAILATQILGLSDEKIASTLVDYKKEMAEKIMSDTYIETFAGK